VSRTPSASTGAGKDAEAEAEAEGEAGTEAGTEAGAPERTRETRGMGRPAGPMERPHAVVSVRGRVARVRIALALGYPSDVGAQCGAVRRHVVERVRALAGMEVPEVAVTVERLHSSQTDRGSRGRVR
jgi:hypothetical protein